MADKFDVFNQDGVALATGEASPITITGLKPSTTYSGWYVTLTGNDEKTIIPDFTTTASTTTTTSTTIVPTTTTTTSTTAKPTTTTTTSSTTVAPTTTTTTSSTTTAKQG